MRARLRALARRRGRAAEARRLRCARSAGPPPIPLRFIGIVDETRRHLKLAVLSDGRNVFYGREGDIIEGRYRILRIGVESIEMTYVDGRGQQTIRLTGS